VHEIGIERRISTSFTSGVQCIPRISISPGTGAGALGGGPLGGGPLGGVGMS